MTLPSGPKKNCYHHGDLRAALLDAGEAVLAENGVSSFSLRKVAARVGVSHSAPAHHFGGARGVLMALAVRGFEQLLRKMESRQGASSPDPYEQLMASGLGYLDFALEHPALFRLIFGSELSSDGSSELDAAGDAAFMHLASAVARLHGAEPFDHPEAMTQVLACWTRAHGFAELLLSGRMKAAQTASAVEREALFRSVFAAEIKTSGKSEFHGL